MKFGSERAGISTQGGRVVSSNKIKQLNSSDANLLDQNEYTDDVYV